MYTHKTSSKIKHFSTEQTTMFKGIGILFIVLHNFFHHLAPILGENEFSFAYEPFWNFYHLLLAHPEKSLQGLFSYLGHYGVQIFVFFSAYGLTRKYHQQPLILSQFLKTRIYKIYFSFLLCLAVYLLLGLIKVNFLPHEKIFYWDSLLWKVLLISNFLPGQALMPVGPWWFIPFIMQVYVLYPFLLKGYQKYGRPLLVLISLVAILSKTLLNPYLIACNTNINYLVFGHLSVICLGIALGAQEAIKIPGMSILLALILFIFSQVNPYIWLVSDIAFTTVFLAVSISICRSTFSSKILTQLLSFYGAISFQLFMVNGFLRSPFHNFAESHNVWWLDNLVALASLLFSTLFAYVLKRLDDSLRVALKIE